MDQLTSLSQSFHLDALLDMPLTGFFSNLPQSTIQIAIGGLLLFLLLLTFGYARHHMLAWSMKGAWVGLFFGVLLTLVGIIVLFVGGRVVLIQALHTESIPPAIRLSVKQYLTEFAGAIQVESQALGLTSQQPTRQTVMADFKNLSLPEQQDVQRLICSP